MADIIFISGGCRSGKSNYAEKLTFTLPSPHVYLATCPRVDQDMDDRIHRHQQQRVGKGWLNIEEELDLEKVFRENSGATILVDCVTLWINNLMWQAEQKSEEINEVQIAERCDKLLKAIDDIDGTVIFVSNETGMGIMPVNRQARIFGDLAGRCNQILAAAAKQATFMVSGIPMQLKN